MLSIVSAYYRAKNKMLDILGYSICYVVTGSMEPVLNVGDVVLIKDIDPFDIKINDIITYKSTSGPLSGNFITHRVVKVNTDGENIFFFTKGEANISNDTEVITPDKIMGVYQNKLPILKTILTLLSNPIIFILIVITPLLFSLMMQLTSFFIAIKKNKE